MACELGNKNDKMIYIYCYTSSLCAFNSKNLKLMLLHDVCHRSGHMVSTSWKRNELEKTWLRHIQGAYNELLIRICDLV